MTKMSIEHLWSAHLNQMTFLQNTDLVAFHHSVQPVLNLKPDWGLLVIPNKLCAIVMTTPFIKKMINNMKNKTNKKLSQPTCVQLSELSIH